MTWGARRVFWISSLFLLLAAPVFRGNAQEKHAEQWQADGIAAALADPLPSVKVRALQQIREFEEFQGIPSSQIVPFLKDSDSDVRFLATRALDAMRAKEHAEKIADLLNNQNESELVRAAAAQALARMWANDPKKIAKLLNNPDSMIHHEAEATLQVMQAKKQPGEAAKLQGKILTEDEAKLIVTKLDSQISFERSAAELWLSEIRVKDQPRNVARLLEAQTGKIIKQLSKPYVDIETSRTVGALEAFAPFSPSTLPSLAEAYYFNHAKQGEIRFLCYYLTGGSRPVKLILQRTLLEGDQSDQKPKPFASVEEAREALQAFHEVLPPQFVDSEFATKANKQILQIARDWRRKWSPEDRELLLSLSQQMSEESGAALRGLVEIPWWQTALSKFWKIIAVQLVFWVLLLYFYPTSTQVQAFFFWNRWARKFFGLGYVDLCLTWIPFLRNRLLAPFRQELLADANLQDQNLKDYFEDIEVQDGEKRRT